MRHRNSAVPASDHRSAWTAAAQDPFEDLRTNSALESAAPRHTFRGAIGCVVWSAMIVAATVPWTDFVGHTHWQKVQWIPFRSPPVKPLDVVANVLLYLPLGYTLLKASASRARVWHALALAAALSLLVEWSQLYSHYRFPSVQDVICNVSGAWAGAWLARRRPIARGAR